MDRRSTLLQASWVGSLLSDWSSGARASRLAPLHSLQHCTHSPQHLTLEAESLRVSSPLIPSTVRFQDVLILEFFTCTSLYFSTFLFKCFFHSMTCTCRAPCESSRRLAPGYFLRPVAPGRAPRPTTEGQVKPGEIAHTGNSINP